MTRQKKELIKAIDRLNEIIGSEEAMGCGSVHPAAFTDLYHQHETLLTQLAHLQHYKDLQEMMNDDRQTLALMK